MRRLAQKLAYSRRSTVTRIFIFSPDVRVPPLNYHLVPVEESPTLVCLIPPLKKLVPPGHFCQVQSLWAETGECAEMKGEEPVLGPQVYQTQRRKVGKAETRPR